MSNLEWGDLKVVLALSRGGSVAAASRILGVDSSTVSRRLAAAEEALGACLLLRGGREFRFTAEGNMAVQTAEAVETAINSAASAIKSAKQAIEGKVIISTVGSFFHVLNPVCDILRAKHPALQPMVDDSDHVVNLAAGEADIAIRMYAPKEPDLISRKAFDLGWCVYASRDYVARYGLPKTESELRDHRLVLYSEDRSHLPGFAWLDQFKSGRERYARVNNTGVALRAVLDGAGIGGLPAYEGAEHLGLVRVFPKRFHIQPAFIVYHESQRDSARIRAVADELMAYLAKKKALLLGSG
ncbi:MAG: LysR family transcriptional regulator [Alphaproteobacteria bacterium]|nr:LysR family transcriptional regulator [Alphaproteobacteria bacterium]